MFPIGLEECVMFVHLYYFDDLPVRDTKTLLELVDRSYRIFVPTESTNDLLVEPSLVIVGQR